MLIITLGGVQNGTDISYRLCFPLERQKDVGHNLEKNNCFILFYVYGCQYVCLCTTYVPGISEARKEGLIPRTGVMDGHMPHISAL